MLKRRLEIDSMNKNPDDSHCFFKIMFDGVTTEHLRIPPKFVKHLPEKDWHRAILKGPSGSHWHVEVHKNEHGMFLEDGWQSFLNDHSLWDNEFLVFRYDGNMCFNVQIFGKNGCERIDDSIINSRQESAFSEGKGKYPVGFLHAHESNPDKNAPGAGGHSPTEEEGEKNLETAESFTSRRPYFESRLTSSSVEHGLILSIPTFFSRTNLPKSRTNIILQNSEGRAWEVMCINSGKKCVFSGGWSAFVRGNELEVGDICIFELVDGNKMQVHIFRSSKKG